MNIAGAIIAGGRSSRMGTDKAFTTVGSNTILNRIVACIERQVDLVILNTNGDPSSLSGMGLTVVADMLRGVNTPLAGIHATLAWGAEQGCEWIVTVPADTPFLPTDLTSRLLTAAQVSGAAIAASGGQKHFVIGAWSTRLAGELETAIVRDKLFRIRDWAERAKAAEVAWPVTDYDPFFNVNTPEDLATAERLVAG